MGILSIVVQAAVLWLPKPFSTSWTSQSSLNPCIYDVDEAVRISHDWHVLGPFQIGTREAAWSSDPLEYHGGFSNLTPNHNDTFASAIARTGKVRWSQMIFDTTVAAQASAQLSFAFPHDVDWTFLQQVYGWAATQWQAWARGEIVVGGSEPQTLLLYTDNILEYVVNNQRMFGGDFFGFRRAPVVLQLAPGKHVIDMRLVRDVRAMGGIGLPSLDVTFEAVAVKSSGLHVSHVLMPDVVNGRLSSPYGSMIITNTRKEWLVIDVSSKEPDVVKVEPLMAASPQAFKLAPGQSRPFAMVLELLAGETFTFSIRLFFQEVGNHGALGRGSHDVSIKLQHYSQLATHRITYLHPTNIVSYATMRAPSANATCAPGATSAAVMVLLHGAGVEADSPIAKEALNTLPDLCAWVLTPSGTTPWSGDDWHIWGWADVEGAINALPLWLKSNQWKGIDVDTSKILLVGHSNGGQGVWYGLSHHPDNIIAAAPLSGYLSISWYVPTTFWRSSDPSKRAMIQFAQSSFAHDLMASNFAHVPIFQQHGDLDDNVPAFHSSLMHQLIAETGSSSHYDVVEGRGHWWETVATEPRLAAFYRNALGKPRTVKLHDVDAFDLVVADPGDSSGRFGVRILYLQEQGSMGSLKVIYVKERKIWRFVPKNVMAFEIPDIEAMAEIEVEDNFGLQSILYANLKTQHSRTIVWHSASTMTWTKTDPPYPPTRKINHFGGLSAILRAKNGPFIINATSPELVTRAVQVSRNLITYFGADTVILQANNSDFTQHEDIYSIVLSIGDSETLSNLSNDFPLRIFSIQKVSRLQYKIYNRPWRTFATQEPHGAIFLHPRPDHGLEIVVWGSDMAMVEQMARLLPLITGTGQPDWIMCTKEMMWKGIEGCDLGWFNAWWQIQGR